MDSTTKILFSRSEARARSRCMPRPKEPGEGCGERERKSCHTADNDKGLFRLEHVHAKDKSKETSGAWMIYTNEENKREIQKEKHAACSTRPSRPGFRHKGKTGECRGQREEKKV